VLIEIAEADSLDVVEHESVPGRTALGRHGVVGVGDERDEVVDVGMGGSEQLVGPNPVDDLLPVDGLQQRAVVFDHADVAPVLHLAVPLDLAPGLGRPLLVESGPIDEGHVGRVITYSLGTWRRLPAVRKRDGGSAFDLRSVSARSVLVQVPPLRNSR